MDQAFLYCQQRVREADHDRFLATLFAPEPYRGPLFALYAFDAEIAQVRDRIGSPLPGEVRLQWWRDVLAETRSSEFAASPIATGLMQTVRRFALPVGALVDLIDSHTFDLYEEPMTTLAALERYAAGTTAATIHLAARVLNDGKEPGHEGAFQHAGMACTVAALLRNLPVHSARGQQYVPDDILARHGTARADLHAGQATAALRTALAELHRVAGSHLLALRTEGSGVPSHLLPAFLPAFLVPGALAVMERRDGDPLHPRTAPQWRRQWTLWRAARKPQRFIRIKPSDPVESGDRQ